MTYIVKHNGSNVLSMAAVAKKYSYGINSGLYRIDLLHRVWEDGLKAVIESFDGDNNMILDFMKDTDFFTSKFIDQLLEEINIDALTHDKTKEAIDKANNEIWEFLSVFTTKYHLTLAMLDKF